MKTSEMLATDIRSATRMGTSNGDVTVSTTATAESSTDVESFGSFDSKILHSPLNTNNDGLHTRKHDTVDATSSQTDHDNIGVSLYYDVSWGDVSDDTENFSCEDFMCFICVADQKELPCDGPSSHFFSFECFNQNAETASFQVSGRSFVARITSYDIVSQAEELPTGSPFFLNDGCKCRSVPPTTLGRFFSSRADLREDRAFQRMEEGRLAENISKEVEPFAQYSFDSSFRAVQDVSVVGDSRACPQWGYRVGKDGSCMYITRENVECRNFCGRYHQNNGREIRCRSCEQNYVHLRIFPSCDVFFCEEEESSGYDALREFHRWKVTCFVPPLNELLTSFPDNDGQTIENIQHSESPVFEPIQVEDVALFGDAHLIIDRLTESLANIAADVCSSCRQRDCQEYEHHARPGDSHQHRCWHFGKLPLVDDDDDYVLEAQFDQDEHSFQDFFDGMIGNDTLDEDISNNGVYLIIRELD